MTGTGVAPNYSCRACGAQLCGCADALYAGIVSYDRESEPGAWAQHLRDTACMRDEQLPSSGIPPLGDTSGAEPHRPAPFSSEARP